MRNPSELDDDQPVLVVGVGASAGGLQAFKQLLSVLPSNSGMAFLLVQHLDPSHESLLSELLASSTGMPVVDAEHGAPLRANTVHVIMPGCALAIRDGHMALSEPTLHRGVRLPVNHLFDSLAREYGSSAVGIVLSGAGSDGSAALRNLKTAGGLVIAQEPGSSGQTGMPQSAIDTRLVDLILEIDEMPAALQRFADLPEEARLDPPAEEDELARQADDDKPDQPPVLPRQANGEDTAIASGGMGEADDDDVSGNRAAAGKQEFGEQQLRQLKSLISAQTDFDLGIYKPKTVRRRLMRRMLLSGFDDTDVYLSHVRDHPEEQQSLVRDLLISVTSFFRDPSAYQALRESVIEPMIAMLDSDADIRMWVAGCATGEEAYSIAMTVLDVADERGKSVELQLFATDVDQAALSVAREGIYTPASVEQVSRRRLDRYFEVIEGRGYRVRSFLRDRISFAIHDLSRDPPFSRMHLVSFRNVMIYLTPETQEHCLGVIHFALRPEGCLFLGTSEVPGMRRELFNTVSKAGHLYRKAGTSRTVVAPTRSKRFPLPGMRSAKRGGARANDEPGKADTVTDPARRFMLETWAPPTIVVGEEGNLLFLHGELGQYLHFPQGDEPRLYLDSMLRDAYATRILGALYRCRRQKEPVEVVSRVDGNDGVEIRITAKPAPKLGTGVVMLSFQSVDNASRALGAPEGNVAAVASGAQSAVQLESQDTEVIQRLDEELKATREDLRNTVEELESSNEELRSSNEESMSMNEELQATNEELEATTEELRSLNEELSTVNGQLRGKIEQQEQTSDDLSNFFASAAVPILFLDEQLRIKRFTPSARELLGIDQSDVGRHTSDIARELLQRGLEADARWVLEHLTVRSAELSTHDGRWFTRQVLPYRTSNRRIEGVVVTLLDVTELKQASERLAARERQQRVIARLGFAALSEGDLQEFMERTTRELNQTLDLDHCKILELQPGGHRMLLRAGVGWNEGLVGSGWVDSGVDTQAGYTLSVPDPVIVEDIATDQRFSDSAMLLDHAATSGLSCVIRAGDQVYGVMGGYTSDKRLFTQEDSDFILAAANIVGSTFNRYEDQLRQSLDSAVARVLAERRDIDGTLTAVQSALVAEFGCDLSELWWTDEQGSFNCRHLHITSPEGYRRIRDHMQERDITAASDLVTQVQTSELAVWATDIGDPALFADDEHARNFGFTSAIALPIKSEDRLLGVLTLYARWRLFPIDILMRSLTNIGLIIGAALVRIRQEEREERLAAITASSHDAIFSHDIEGQVTEWLSGAERLYGFDADEMVGQSVERLVPAEQKERQWAITQRILAGEIVEPFETRRLSSDNRQIEVSVRSAAIRGAGGAVAGVSYTERDITRLKDTQRQLVNADRQKDEFIAMLGHELRNPLSSIRSAAELLKMNDSNDPDIRYSQEVLERQSNHMAKLLDGLLDVSRIISGKITLDIQSVDFTDVCREVLADTQLRVGEAGLMLTHEIPDKPIMVEADRLRLVQIVDNLVSNAIRYSRQTGSISLILSVEDELSVLRISDDGVGIEADLLPRVFDVFWQSHQNLDRARGGLGLGLSLVQALAELHGGSIQAFSEGTDKGAEFVFRMPLGAPGKLSTNDAGVVQQALLDILIIEDNRDNADLISRVLVHLGHRVTAVSDGSSGVESATQQRPDVVLCDLGLPGELSGFDVAQKLREQPETANIRLIALSGYGSEAVRRRSSRAGFELHLTKPVGIQDLKVAIGAVRASD